MNTSASDFTIDDLVNYERPRVSLSGGPAKRQDSIAPTDPTDVHHDR